MSAAALEHAKRYAWPHVAEEVLDVYEQARAVPRPERAVHRTLAAAALVPADGGPRAPAKRLPSLEPRSETRRAGLAFARKAVFGVAAVLGFVLSWLALQRIGLDRIGDSLLRSQPVWVIAGLGLMCASMILRAFSWHAILRAALGGLPVCTCASATRCAARRSACSCRPPCPHVSVSRPRAIIVARRVGRPRETLPTVLGTIVSQTVLNVVALIVLGVTMFSTVDIFRAHHGALLAFAVAPVGDPHLGARGARDPARWRALAHRAGRRWRWPPRAARSRALRNGLVVFRSPKLGTEAAFFQLSAWALQWLSCYVLLAALGLDDPRRRRRCRGRAVRRQRHRRPPGDPVEPRCLPGDLRGGVGRRLRHQLGRRARLRNHPAGGGDRDRRRHGGAGARRRGPLVQGHAPARTSPDARRAAAGLGRG